jgi:hypothetical protein
MYSGSCLFRNSLYICLYTRVKTRVDFELFFDRSEEKFFFFTGWSRDLREISFCFASEDDERRGISSIIEDHIRSTTIMPLEDLMCVVPVLFEGFSFFCEYRYTSFYDRRGGVILRRKYITTCPSYLGTECCQRFDEYSCLDRHMQ